MNTWSVLRFVLTLGIIAPLVAIAGVTSRGAWVPAGLMVAGALVFWTARRALVPIRSVPMVAWLRRELLILLWLVIVIAATVTAASVFSLGWHLVG